MSDINDRAFNLMQDAQKNIDFGPDSIYQATTGRNIQLPAIASDSGESYIGKNPSGEHGSYLKKTDSDYHGTKFESRVKAEDKSIFENGRKVGTTTIHKFPKSMKIKVGFISDNPDKVSQVEIPFDVNNIYMQVDSEGRNTGGYLRYRQADGSDVFIGMDLNDINRMLERSQHTRTYRAVEASKHMRGSFDAYHRTLGDKDKGMLPIYVVKPDGSSDYGNYNPETRMFYQMSGYKEGE